MLVALGLGAWLDVAPLASIEWSARGLGAGIAATAPLVLGLWWCRRTTFAPVARLVTFVERRVAPMFAGCSLAVLALVAAMAGVGEELLFRGVLQPALQAHVSAWLAVAIVGALFGLVHWLTPMYAVLAAHRRRVSRRALPRERESARADRRALALRSRRARPPRRV